MMRESKVLKKLRSNQIVNCTKINITDAKVSEIASICGLDCVWIDQEHIGQDWSTVEANIWATKAHDTDIIVRVSRGGYSDYIRPLELDATGIMVPHVMGENDAKDIIRKIRFHPVGRRPLDGGNADGAYTAMDFKTYLKQGNEERMVILQIEDQEGLNEIEAIASLKGFDMLFFGPGDFSQSLGFPGEINREEVIVAKSRVARVAKKYGKFAGTVGTLSNLKELVAMGYQFISIGADVVGLSNYYKEILNGFQKGISQVEKTIQ